MPLETISLAVVRPAKTRTATGGYTSAEAPVPGSPFTARVYRTMLRSVGRDEAPAATATVDHAGRVSFADPKAAVRVNDICLLPLPDGTTQRAKIILVRRYDDRVQVDLETGAE